MAKPVLKWALLVALAAIAVPTFVYRDRTKAAIDGAHQWVANLGIYAYPIWVVLHALFIVLCFPGTVAFEGAAGLLFGVVRGSAAVLAAKTLGAAVAFWLGKTLLCDQVKAYAHSYPKFQVVVHGVRRDGWWFVLLARLSPIPSWVNNYGLAAVDVPFFPDYILASCAGTLPFILLNTYAGYLADQGLSATNGRSWHTYALPTLGLVAGLALFWKLTTYAKNYQEALGASPAPATEAEDTASEVVFLNEDQSVGPAGGLRSRTKAGGELTFSEDLGLVASPMKKGRARKKEAGEEKAAKEDAANEKVMVEEVVSVEMKAVKVERKTVKVEPADEKELTSPRRSSRPRRSIASPPPRTKTPSRSSVTSPMTSPGRRRPIRPRKLEDMEL